MRLRAPLVVALILLTTACSDNSAPPPLAAQVESGFDFQEDAFLFENFGGSTLGPQLSASSLVRMFGTDVVCVPGSDPCELTAIAADWQTATNATLDRGRSEGFATLSLLFFKGDLDPKDFGAETPAGLALAGNALLQEELAYWAAMQAVPSAVIHDERFQAKDVMRFLEKALAPEAETAHRLAIAQKTDRGLQRGHALTPIGYYRGEGDVYWLRVYDNNFPSREQRLEIKPKANTWRYEVAGPDGAPIVYEGSEENGNLLYFSNVRDRLGVQQAPFAPDSEVMTLSYGGLTVMATVDGQQSGIRDGEVIESGDDRVVPAFSSCPLCGTEQPIINQTLLSKGIRTRGEVVIESSDSVSTWQNTGSSGGGPFIAGTGANYHTKVYPSGDTENDVVRFSGDGDVAVVSRSGEGIRIRTSKEIGNTVVSFEVNIPDPGDGSEVTVTITTDDDGRAQITVDGAPEGAVVQVSQYSHDYDTNKRQSESVTFRSTGETATANVDIAEGAITAMGVSNLQGGTCANGMLDADTETDVDCGGECNDCTDGKRCTASTDCVGTCGTDGLCVSSQCLDGIRNGSETDIDCGGDLCRPCRATNEATSPTCNVASDCDSKKCISGRCKALNSVYARANRVPTEGIRAAYLLDGVRTDRTFQGNGTKGPQQFLLGSAYEYQMIYAGTCSFDTLARTTGRDDASDKVDEGFTDWDCPEDNRRNLTVKISYFDDLPPLPESNPVTVRVVLDGMPSEIDVWGEDSVNAGSYASTYSSRVSRQAVVTTPDHYFCYIFNDSNPANVSCSRTTGTPSCSDGYLNQDESDKDCGGVCSDCGLSRLCHDASDCASGACGAGYDINFFMRDFVCIEQTDSCTDMTKNQDETDVDCGGATCSACPAGKACAQNSDCSNMSCVQNVCTDGTCTDMAQNQDETDVDCGGGTCSACAAGRACSQASDCASAVCATGMCVAATCSDGVQNQDETGIDCGGSTCGGCQCVSDNDCGSMNCECGANSGNCPTGTGRCGAAKWVFDTPTTDGVAASGTLTVPAGCNSVYVQAWGAAGGSGGVDDFGMIMCSFQGGAGGHVSGTMTVAPGDTIDVWVGAGGSTPGMGGLGSYMGIATSGGAGDQDFTSASGGGGGLTSLRQTGSATQSFVVPAGAGAQPFNGGASVADGMGGGALDSNGVSSPFGAKLGGGGAGEIGGVTDAAGTYGSLPTGLMTSDGSGGTPAAVSNPDYASCLGPNGGNPGAGAGNFAACFGGDGCVVLRCTGQ